MVDALATAAWAAASADALTPEPATAADAVLEAGLEADAAPELVVAAGAVDDELELPDELQAASAKRAAATPAPANLLDFT
jgi:hypothetical protein